MARPGRLPDFRKMYPEASDEVIEVLKETERKMQYQEYDLKAEQTVIDQKTAQVYILPSREDSYERLVMEHGPMKDEGEEVESKVINRMMNQQLYEAIHSLEEKEQYLIIQLFFLERSERELAAEWKVSQNAVHKQRRRILSKLKKYFEKFSF